MDPEVARQIQAHGVARAHPRPPSFVSLDFECANASHASVCAIGVTRVVDGVVQPSKHWFVRPLPPYDFLGGMNERITGIKTTDLRDARGFDVLGENLMRNIDGGIIVGHGVKSADLSMFEQSWHHAGLGKFPDTRFVCTVELAQKVLPGMDSYKLDAVTRELLGEDMPGHHQADVDAHTTARIAVELLAGAGLDIEHVARTRPGRNPRPIKPPYRAAWSYDLDTGRPNSR